MVVSENKKATTFKEHVELVEAGEMTRALDKASDWKEDSAFGGSAFGPTRDEKKKGDDDKITGTTGTIGTELTTTGPGTDIVQYYDEVTRELLPGTLRPQMPVRFPVDSGRDFNPVDWTRGKLFTDLGNGKWTVQADDGTTKDFEIRDLKGPEAGIEYQESVERLKELAGIPESASGGATGAGNIASAPGAIGSGMLKRTKTKIKIKKKKREQ